MTIRCANCRFENPNDTLYCGNCAAPLQPADNSSSKTDTLSANKKELTLGSTFARRYKILEKIGKGGMGRVYKVFDTEIKEKIALKVINPELLEDLLSPYYRVQKALGGREALEKAQSDLPDLILLDIMMPEIDGYEVCKQLKSKPLTSIIPVVMVTALKEKSERIKALDVGADDFLSKPVDKAELLARVKSILRIKRLHDELLEANRTLERKVREQVGQIQNLGKLKQYFSPKLAERLVSEKDIYKIRRKSLTIFFVDIRDFYTFSEMIEPEELVTLLDKFFLEMTQVIFDWAGTVGKFISDGILGFFGDPEECPNHAELAVKMALDMQHRVKLFNEESPFWKEFPLSIGIGINTGYVTVGNIGPENYRDYTVIGRNVNLAAGCEGYIVKPIDTREFSKTVAGFFK